MTRRILLAVLGVLGVLTVLPADAVKVTPFYFYGTNPYRMIGRGPSVDDPPAPRYCYIRIGHGDWIQVEMFEPRNFEAGGMVCVKSTAAGG